jgi:hypothetical protein
MGVMGEMSAKQHRRCNLSQEKPSWCLPTSSNICCVGPDSWPINSGSRVLRPIYGAQYLQRYKCVSPAYEMLETMPAGDWISDKSDIVDLCWSEKSFQVSQVILSPWYKTLPHRNHVLVGIYNVIYVHIFGTIESIMGMFHIRGGW